MGSKWFVLLAAVLPLAPLAADGALTTNSWFLFSGKWENGANWSAGTPHPTNAVNTITNDLSSIVVTIDTGTVTQHVINSCMTISNLVVGRGSVISHTLFMNNANNTPGNIGLTILNSFTLNATGILSITNSDLRVTSPTGGFFINGTALHNFGTITCTNLSVGRTGVGTMTVSNGTLVTRNLSVADLPGSQGTFSIAGGSVTSRNLSVAISGLTGTVWMTGGQLIISNESTAIGDTGVGTMTISNGTCTASIISLRDGTLTIAGGTSKFFNLLMASGASTRTGTVWMIGGNVAITNTSTAFVGPTNDTVVGLNGVGVMTMSNGTFLGRTMFVGTNTGSVGTFTMAGGTNTLTSILSLGGLPAATGTVWITGGRFVVTNNDTTVGFSGVGQATISNGTWRTSALAVGRNAGSRGTVTIAGGTNIVSSLIIIGLFPGATGDVWVTGGQLIATNFAINVASSGVGQLTVSNGNCQLEATFVGSGAGSRGALTVAGGTNTVTAEFVIGANASATGTVWVTDGQLTSTNNDSDVGRNGVGQLTVSNGNWQARNVNVGHNAGSSGGLTIAGGTSSVYSNLIVGICGSATGIVNVAGGGLFVTNAAGNAVLEVRGGTLTLSSGTLMIDRLVITNSCARFIHTAGTLVTSTNILTGAFDADGDGLPNSWEQQYGLDPFSDSSVNGAAGDPDGDGFTNLQEYLAGTDPTVNDFHITAIVREGNDIRITWATVGGTTNRVLVSTGDAAGGFTNNFSNLSPRIFIQGTGATTTNYLDGGGATNAPTRYYRVRRGFETGGARFLFDAGHAQSAGNADWVVDADVRNITWNSSGTFTISGSDSNAQRIPTPAASGIISSTPETYWDGALSAWAVDLVKRGHSVETLPAGATFTYNTANSQDLTNYNVVVVDEPNILFALAEKQALLSFVSNGGSLFMISDHTTSDRNGDGIDSPIVWMDFLTNNLVTNNPFGIVFPSSNSSGTNTFNHNIVGDAILNGPVGLATNTAYFSGNKFQIDHTKNPTVTSHMWFGAVGDSNNLCAVASLRYGNGRVVVCGDSSPMEDGTGDPGDGLFNGYTDDLGDTNRIWILNASEWLAAPFQ